MSNDSSMHATTIVTVRKAGKVVIAGDGQVSLGQTIMKGNAKKVRRLGKGNVIAGFAGATADAFTLLERLETKLEQYPDQLTRACVELAKDWRTDRYLRRLEAMMIVADKSVTLALTGTGDVLEPENGVMAIGSGGNYALAAARALDRHRRRRRDDRPQGDADRCRHLRLHQPQCGGRSDRCRLNGATATASGRSRKRTCRCWPRWLAEPHVAEWWDDPEVELAEIREHIDSISVEPLIVELDGQPIGYLQSYDPHLEDGHPYQDQPFGTLGIDISIGDPELVGIGHGSAIVRQFADELFAEGAPRVIIDPDPANGRAIRAYEKAGFRPIGERTSEYGHVLLMARDAEEGEDRQ